jgi:hypothetical protein
VNNWQGFAKPEEIAEYESLAANIAEANKKRAAIRSRCRTRMWRAAKENGE